MSDRREKQNRRNRSERRRFRGRCVGSTRIAVVEISRRYLRVVIMDRDEENTSDRVFTETVEWNSNKLSLHTPAGLEALAKGLKQITEEFGLQGLSLKVVLSGEFCVTRAIRGASEVVRFELQRLEQRSRLYLSLGPGKKVVASNAKAVDARHMHALAAACNAKTLDTIHQAAELAGMQVESIEPALVSVSSAVHRLENEPDEPYLILYLDGPAAEIGVCHQGQLLLDYRPGCGANAEDLHQLIRQHRGRLQRHAGRHLDIAPPTISHLFLCGEKAVVDATYAEFTVDDSFQTTRIDPNAIQATWSFPEGEDNSEMVPALGALLSTYLAPADRVAPNFMEYILSISREPLRPTLLRSAIPIAATLLIAMGITFVNFRQQGKLHALQDQLHTLAPVQTEAKELRLQLLRSERKLSQLEHLADGLHAVPANDVLNRIGQCMPNDVWLQQLEINDMQSVQISGASFMEAGVYDFVRWLEQAPGLNEVALQATQAGNSQAGPTVNFGLVLSLADHTN